MTARRSPLRVKTLADLRQIHREMQLHREQAQAAERERAKELARQQARRNLFTHSVGPVQPLRHSARVDLAPAPPGPVPEQFLQDEQRVLQQSISDEFDISTLLDADDSLSFRRPGIGVDVTRRLRQGRWSIQRQLDLHGLRTDEARQALGEFLRTSRQAGVRCVRIIHGKGLGSPGKTPVLKSRVPGWLAQKNEVLAFVQARPADGGAGALVVLLQPSQPRTAQE